MGILQPVGDVWRRKTVKPGCTRRKIEGSNQELSSMSDLYRSPFPSLEASLTWISCPTTRQRWIREAAPTPTFTFITSRAGFDRITNAGVSSPLRTRSTSALHLPIIGLCRQASLGVRSSIDSIVALAASEYRVSSSSLDRPAYTQKSLKRRERGYICTREIPASIDGLNLEVFHLASQLSRLRYRHFRASQRCLLDSSQDPGRLRRRMPGQLS